MVIEVWGKEGRHVGTTPHALSCSLIGQGSTISINTIGCPQERKDENTGRGTMYSYAEIK